jgi:hypothetical protein
MSDNEIRQQKAMLLLEHQEAQERLAALQEKATRIGRDVQQFGRWLENDAARQIYIRSQEQYGFGLQLQFLDEPKYRAAVSFDQALQLADEIRKALTTEKDLTERLRRHP